MKKNWTIAAVMAVAVALLAGGGTFVMAQATETTPPAICGNGQGLHGFGANSDVITDLLGLTPEELYQLRTDG